MILFCELGEEQRKIYDAYRNDYRDKILGVVEDKGVEQIAAYHLTRFDEVATDL